MKFIYLYAASAFVILFFSCQTPRLGLSDGPDDSYDEYRVKGRQGVLIRQKLGFGEYETNRVRRSWTRGSSARTGISTPGSSTGEWVNLISLEYVSKRQTVNFRLMDGNNHSDVYAASRFNAMVLQAGPRPSSVLNILLDFISPSSNNYYVQLYINDDREPWQLLLDNQASQARAQSYMGVLAHGSGEYYTIHPVSTLLVRGRKRNMPFGSAGYEIRDSRGRPVAAVSTMDQGRIFLKKGNAAERFLMANLCAAILLQEQLN